MVVVRGDIRDKVSGEILPWTLVFIGDSKGFSDERGEFEFIVPIGTYTCGVRHAYYEPVTLVDQDITGDSELQFRPIRAKL